MHDLFVWLFMFGMMQLYVFDNEIQDKTMKIRGIYFCSVLVGSLIISLLVPYFYSLLN
jgi:hypothetical protein